MPSYLKPLAELKEGSALYDRAIKRAEKRVEEREHLRLELKAREYIHTVHGIIDTLCTGYEQHPMEDGSEQRVPLDRGRVQALKTAMDGSLRLLDRVLPPLKAVEVTRAPGDEANAMTLTTAELIKLALAGKAPITVEADVVEVEEPEKLPPPPWE